MTWGNRYLKQKPPFGCVFTQKTKQQNSNSVSFAEETSQGKPRNFFTVLLFSRGVMEDRKSHNHHYAPTFINPERSCAGQAGPSSTSIPDLGLAGQYSPATCGSKCGLPAFQNSPSPPQGSKSQSKLFPLPSRQPPQPAEHLARLLQLEIFWRGTEFREGKRNTEQLGFLSETLFHEVRPDEFNISTDWE